MRPEGQRTVGMRGSIELQGTKCQCPACGSACGRKRGQKNDHDVICCRRCATLYVSAVTQASIADLYAHYYDHENLSVPDFIDRRLDEIVADFAPYRQTSRLLDIGFGAGSLLRAAARARWTVSGVEVSQTAARHVDQFGLDIFCGELADAQYPDAYFDIVTASEVLEHVPEPRALVREIARIVRPGGLLWATTPHGRGISSRILGLQWSVIMPPEHLQLFSVGSIRALFADTGFHRVRVATHGINLAELLASADPSHRVKFGHRLNEFMDRSRTRRALKDLINRALNVSRLGDSLKIWAVK
jgi:2-polyprenyl-3-methyl-5-hydroxy-6-metoxy-1,4-benzoquinol methylase